MGDQKFSTIVPGPGHQRVVGISRGRALRERSLGACIFLWILAAFLLLGGVHRQIAIGLSGTSFVAFIAYFPQLRRGWGAMSWLCLGLATMTAVTAIPLPSEWGRVLAPDTAKMWQEAASPFGGRPGRWVSLSVAPAATWLEALKYCVYAGWCALGSEWAARRGQKPALLTVWATAVIVATITLAHELVGAEQVFGIYEPQDAVGAALVTVLLNPNNLAGLMILGVFCGIGLVSTPGPLASKALRPEPGKEGFRPSAPPRPLIGVGVVLCTSVVILSASRGGVFVLSLGLLASSVLLARSRGSGRARFRALAPVLLIAILGLGIAYLGGTSATWKDLLGDDLSKLREVGVLLPALAEHWLVGLGRGGFESASAALLAEPRHITHSYVENFAMSWLLECGLVVGGSALILLMILMRPSRLYTRGSRSTLAALVGLYCFLAQNLLDLGFEVMALAAAFFLLCGALTGAKKRRRSGRSQGPQSMAPAIGLLALSFLTLAAAQGTGPSLRVERQQLRELVGESAQEREIEVVEDRLERAMLRWPSDPYFPLLGAQWALLMGRDALPFASAALKRAPGSGLAHLATADALSQRGATSQALIHLRHAMKDETLVEESAARAVRWTRAVDRLIRTAPDEPIGGKFLVQIVRRLRGELSAEKMKELHDAARERAPRSKSVLVAEAEFLLSHDPTSGDLERVEQIAQELRGQPACEALRFRARVLERKHRARQAVTLLERCNRCRYPEPCARLRVRIAKSLEDPELRRTAEKGYVAAVCRDAASCAAAHDFLGRQAQQRGDRRAALMHFRDAARRVPTPDRLRAVIRAALATGHIGHARLAYRRLTALGAHDEELRQKIEQSVP